jgi:phage shock protein A
MSVFKRISATISSRVDQLVSQVENHDAVVESSIREARQAVAKSKVRLARLNNDGTRLRRKLADLQHAEGKWRERAKSVAAQDEDRAIECLRRRQECQRQITDLNGVLDKHHSLEQRLTRDIRTAEERVSEMSQKRNFMRTRQSAAEALNAISDVDDNVSTELADTFERWEIRVTEAELEAGTSDLDLDDAMEREFIDAEQRDALRAELQQLLRNEEVSDERKS